MITEFLDPIWEQQEGETARQFYFFLLFVKFRQNITIHKFYEKVQKEFRKNSDNQYTLPTYSTFERWAYTNKWIIRKEASRKHDNEKLLEDVMQSNFDNLKETFDLTNDVVLEGLRRAKKEIKKFGIKSKENPDGFSAYNFFYIMKGVEIADNMKRLDLGNPTEISNSNVKTENKVEITKSTFEGLDEKIAKLDDSLSDIDADRQTESE